MDDEKDYALLKSLFKKHKLIPVSLYSEINKITRATVYNRVKSGKLEFWKLGETNFVKNASRGIDEVS